MSNELIVIEPKNALTVFTQDNGLDDIIKQVEMEVMTFEHDLTNDARRKKTASLARKVASTKTYLDGLGKDLVSDWKNKAKVVDANRKLMRDRLDELKDIARKPLTEWEAEQAEIEAARIAAEEAEKLRLQVESDHEIALLLNEKFDRELAERLAQEAAEEKARQEAALKAQQEREEQIRKEAEEKAKREAEETATLAEKEKQDAIERAHKAELDRIASEERAKLAAEQAEKDRIAAQALAIKQAKEAAEKARLDEIARQEAEKQKEIDAQKKREADRAYISRIRTEAKESLVLLGLTEEMAKSVVLAISNKQIKNISINY